MKKLLLVCLSSFLFLSNFGQVKMPAPSPTQYLKQDFAIGQIELTYSRPSAKGRKIFGELVPFNAIWRTGANAATLIKFTEPVEIKGKKVDTGSYVLYTIPNADSWEVILNKGLSNWGAAGYKESDDAIRFYVDVQHPRDKVETLTMQFDNIKPASCEISIAWEKTMISIPVVCNINDKLKSNIEAAMLTDKKPYWQAAQFYNEYEKNPAKALENVTKAAEENPKAYWIFLYKAKIQYEMGDKAGAMVSSQKSLDLATADKNDDYVRMNQALQKKLK